MILSIRATELSRKHERGAFTCGPVMLWRQHKGATWWLCYSISRRAADCASLLLGQYDRMSWESNGLISMRPMEVTLKRIYRFGCHVSWRDSTTGEEQLVKWSGRRQCTVHEGRWSLSCRERIHTFHNKSAQTRTRPLPPNCFRVINGPSLECLEMFFSLLLCLCWDYLLELFQTDRKMCSCYAVINSQ